jgi:predicted DNA-binding transcriptional regulator YafY
MFKVRTEDFIEFDYVNWKGKKGHRIVEVLGFVYGTTEFHKEEQWLLRGFDMDKDDFRVFALKDMSNVKKY